MSNGQLQLVLFITGDGTRGQRAVGNLRNLCSGVLSDRCHYEIVDVLEQPDRAEASRIMATPTLVKTSPVPDRRVIGDLSNADDVLAALEIDV
ncbi:circadian clock KaiB family protein [Vreelandella utahensis]|uniref:circadian clock KaiB family protein n=1 Tax=Vreelandella halophila TaxID=86177 RepID=UPI0009875625|nr:circadian clock KaiB family protein [Halomonas utahensis]